MTAATVIVCILTAYITATEASRCLNSLKKEWELYKAWKGVKSYRRAEDSYRLRMYRKTRGFIAEHNVKYQSGLIDYELGLNEFSDWFPHELKNMITCSREMRTRAGENARPFHLTSDLRVPDYVNWVEEGAVTTVKNQGSCGSCWAYAAVGALEGLQFVKNRSRVVPLSAQNLVDCTADLGNHGCKGGFVSRAFDYARIHNGVNPEKLYPAHEGEGKCRFNPDWATARCSGYTVIDPGNEEQLKIAVAKMGPVVVAVDARPLTFRHYKRGIYSDPRCTSNYLVHSVLVVGYGTDENSGKDYWLVKNSWGMRWGEAGYVRMERNANNMCGIASRAIVPVL